MSNEINGFSGKTSTAAPVASQSARSEGKAEQSKIISLNRNEAVAVNSTEEPQHISQEDRRGVDTPTGKTINETFIDGVEKYGLPEFFQRLADGEFTPQKQSSKKAVDAEYEDQEVSQTAADRLPTEGNDEPEVPAKREEGVGTDRKEKQNNDAEKPFEGSLAELAVKEPEFRKILREEYGKAAKEGRPTDIEELSQRAVEKFQQKEQLKKIAAVPEDILDDPNFLELCGKVTIDALRAGVILTPEDASQKAYEQYHKEQIWKEEFPTQFSPELARLILSNDMKGLKREVQGMVTDILRLRQGDSDKEKLIEAQNRLLDIFLIMQLRALEKDAEKEENQEKKSFIDFLTWLAAVFIAEVFVDNEESREKIREDASPKKKNGGRSAEVVLFPTQYGTRMRRQKDEKMEEAPIIDQVAA